MFEEYQICPYTGLRSFTEEESLYFKGREEHIDQATEQLQRNKFLMLTGASGDGKSSLVYAGIVPNARAGFLKSRYTQWKVADFRPERTPFKNLSSALSKQLDIANPGTVEAELEHGFSALVDLYKNSKCFIDVNSNEWQTADENQKATLKRSAANLIIIVDQFEEFFTNPENYHHGVPSVASNLVLNVLLETSRIALEEDLPIYIVFTMRSDYIGQCAAFRSLPEYIGFSQFFVPRLNRVQLQQVIEEPATLSGNRITRRLTERLIHDIAEGVDQLPILQHALNQIWHAADRGKEEMDLIHYAMVGGIASNDLPDDQVDRFNKWFNKLPSKIKACYHEPSLENVLDAHANKLYESAAENYRIKTGKTIPDETAKQIIKTAFICLTKIDQSRAVRNRMTIKEICSILNNPEVDVKKLGTVLNIFREPGNTFIRPFITDEKDTLQLDEEAVLDITHESLIRNWAFLEEWANEEFDNYTISLDFEQQLNRWVESGKSKGFLLSIGPLTYFENWYDQVKPNTYWIARYLSEDIEHHKKMERAQRVLDNSQEFLALSKRRHIVTRTIMQYGPQRIAAVLAIILFLTLSSFVVRNYFRQQNSYVLKSIKEQSLALANQKNVRFGEKITLICEQLKVGQTTIDEVIASILDPVEKINISTGIATLLVFQGRTQPEKEILRSLSLADSLLEGYSLTDKNGKQLSEGMQKIADLRLTLEMAYYYNPSVEIKNLRDRNAKRAASWVIYISKTQPDGFDNIQSFGHGIETAVNYHLFSDSELEELLNILSPFLNKAPSVWLKNNFEKDKLLVRGNTGYGFKFNGLYQFLAYLYAAKGDADGAIQCIDTLLNYNQNYYASNYATGIDHAAHIASVFYKNNQEEASLDKFVTGYCIRKKVSHEEFYERLLASSIYAGTTASGLHYLWFMTQNSNVNLQFSSMDQLTYFFDKFRHEVTKENHSKDEENFILAQTYKNEGILKSLSRVKEIEGQSVSQLFSIAIGYYRHVDQAYLNQSTSIIGISGADQIIVPRKYLFVYPDYKVRFHPSEPRSFVFFYSTDSFMEYVLENNLFSELYPSSNEAQFLRDWFRDYNSKMFAPNFFFANQVRPKILNQLEVEFRSNDMAEKVDLNLLYLYLGHNAQVQGDTIRMLQYYRKVKPENFVNILTTKEFGNNINNQSFRLIAYALEGYIKANQWEEAFRLSNSFKKSINRSSLYAFAATEILREGLDRKIAQRLIDSSYVELDRIENLTTGQPNRQNLSHALVMQNPSKNVDEAYLLIKNLGGKFNAMQRICQSFAFHGELYQAISNIPDFISDTDRAVFLWNIIHGFAEGTQTTSSSWVLFDTQYVTNNTRFINYIDEGS